MASLEKAISDIAAKVRALVESETEAATAPLRDMIIGLEGANATLRSRSDLLTASIKEIETENARLKAKIAELTGPIPHPESGGFNVIGNGGMVPAVVHVDCVDLLAELSIDPIRCDIDWTFGDVGADFDSLRGYNAAHLYRTAGTYKIGLVVTPHDGREPIRRAVWVSVLADTRPVVEGPKGRLLPYTRYVVRGTVDWGLDQVSLPAGCVLEGRDEAKIVSKLGSNRSAIIHAGNNTVIEGIILDSVWDTVTSKDELPTTIKPVGNNVAVVNCEFGDVADCINGNHGKTGLLVQSCRVPATNDFHAYFVWAQGRNTVVVGNAVTNANREHIVRASYGFFGLNISYNNFGVSRGGNITVQKGNYAYVGSNLCRRSINMGPLGDGDGDPGDRAAYFVCELNRTQEQGPINVSHGLDHVRVSDNRVWREGQKAFSVQGWFGTWTSSDGTKTVEYSRGNSDVVIARNTAINNSSRGQFLRIGRAERVELTGNLYIAPNLSPGSHYTAAVYVATESLSTFTKISANVWPRCRKGQAWAQGGVNFIGTKFEQAGYCTPEQWLSTPPVSGDVFRDVVVDAEGNPAEPVDAGATIAAGRE